MNFSSRRHRRPASDINLTPLIDIVFLLLIFFLITTTFVENPGIEVQLPKATAQALDTQHESLIVAVTATGRLIHNGQAVSRDELENRLKSAHDKRRESLVIIQADSTTPHGKVVEVMDLARTIGFSQLAIATEAEL